MVGLTLQDLFNQVIDDLAVIFREAGYETSDVVSTPHRERGQLECGNPPFGALLQGGHVPCGQIKAHHLVEVCRSLLWSEPQVRGSHFDEFAARP